MSAMGLGLLQVTTSGWIEQMLVKLLALAGGAALGALIFGLILKMFAKRLSKRPVPRWAMRIVQGLGALLFGWLVALFLFGGGGGWGGPGGWGFGLGGGPGAQTDTGKKGDATEATARVAATEKKKPIEDPGKAEPGETKIVRVEVLSARAAEGERWYRLEGKPGALTLAETRDALRARHKKAPLEKVVIVVYKDSPDVSAAPVRLLQEAVSDLALTPAIELPDREAP